MQYTGVLFFCLFALTAAKPEEDLQMLIRALLNEIKEQDDLQERDIGAVKFGGTQVGEDYIELKVIRDMKEVYANKKSHKPLYSVIYGKGMHNPNSSEHPLTSKLWSELDKCQKGMFHDQKSGAKHRLMVPIGNSDVGQWKIDIHRQQEGYRIDQVERKTGERAMKK